jgi:hypothetical protein
MGCNDGSTCDTPSEWTCCSGRGGRAKCPLHSPLMCAKPNACSGSSDYCCEPDCDAYGGIRQCGELISGNNTHACLIRSSKAKCDCTLFFDRSRKSHRDPGESCLVPIELLDLLTFQPHYRHLHAPRPSTALRWWQIVRLFQLCRFSTSLVHTLKSSIILIRLDDQNADRRRVVSGV